MILQRQFQCAKVVKLMGYGMWATCDSARWSSVRLIVTPAYTGMCRMRNRVIDTTDAFLLHLTIPRASSFHRRLSVIKP